MHANKASNILSRPQLLACRPSLPTAFKDQHKKATKHGRKKTERKADGEQRGRWKGKQQSVT